MTLHQPAVGYRVAIDPILLAAACPAEPGETSSISAAASERRRCAWRGAWRTCSASVSICKPDLVDLANRNAQENGLPIACSFIAGDILDRALPIYARPADQVIVNPPYLKRGAATPSENPIKALANIEGDADLAAWVAAAAKAVRPGGTITFIHRADRLPELLAPAAAAAAAASRSCRCIRRRAPPRIA